MARLTGDPIMDAPEVRKARRRFLKSLAERHEMMAAHHAVIFAGQACRHEKLARKYRRQRRELKD